jgi:hypothetical protein
VQGPGFKSGIPTYSPLKGEFLAARLPDKKKQLNSGDMAIYIADKSAKHMTIFIADKKFKITLHIITNKKTLR